MSEPVTHRPDEQMADLQAQLAMLKQENYELRSRLQIHEQFQSSLQSAIRTSTTEHRLLKAAVSAANALLTINNFDQAINTALQILGESLETDRVRVLESLFDDPARPFSRYHKVLYEWIRPDTVKRSPIQAEPIDTRHLERYFETFVQNQGFGGLRSEWDESLQALFQGVEVKSGCAIPICVDEQWWGILAFDDCQEAKHHSPAELAALQTAATCIGSAIQRQRMQEVREEAERQALLREKAAQERAAELAKANEALRGTTDRLANEPSLNAVLWHVLSEACRQVNCDAGAIFLYDETSEQLSLSVGVGIGEFPYSSEILLPTANYPGWSVIVQTRKPLFVHPDVNPEMYAEGTLDWHLAQGHQGILVTAMMLGDRPLGQLAVAFRNKHNFQETDIELFQALAQQATLAVQLMHLAEAAQQTAIAREQEKAAQERAVELEKANEALRNAIAGLARLDNLNHFLTEMLKVALEISGAQGGAVVLIDGDVLRLPVLFTKQGLVAPQIQERNGHSCVPFSPELREYAQRISESEQFWLIGSDDPVHPPSFRALHQQEGNRAISHVPMRIGDRFLGWLGLGFAEENPPLCSYALLRVLAEQMTMAIEMLRLAEEAKQAAIAREQEKAAQERVAELEKANDALARTAVRLTEQGDLTHFFDELLIETSRQLGADSAHLIIYDDKQRRYSSLHQYGGNVTHEPELPASFSLDEMPPENFHTIAERECCPHWYDPQADAALFSPGAVEFLSHVGMRSVLHVPLIVGEQIVGGIGFAFREPHPECSQRQILVEALAHQAALAIQLIQLAEEAKQAAIWAERNRMAGEIHDSLSQSFVGVLMQLRIADSILANKPNQAQDYITRAQTLAKEGLTEARLSVWSLSQENTDYCFIADTLSRIVQQLTTGTSIQATVYTQGTPYCLQPSVGLNLLRIAQESLTNSLRYAQANTIEVHLIYAPNYIQLCVQDNGRGFDPQHCRDGFGLINMRRRAEQIGAQFQLQTQPESGTVIGVTVPI